MTTSLTCNGNAYIMYDPAVYIDNALFDDYVMSYRFVEKLNEVPEFECNLLAVDSSLRTSTVKFGKDVQLRSGDALLFPKMMIRRCEYKTNLETTIKGWGYVESILQDKLTETTASSDPESQSGRPQYSGKAVSTIMSEQIGLVSDVSMDTNSNTKVITIRGENDNILSFLAGCVDVSNGDWWSSYGGTNYETNYFNSSDDLIASGYYGRGSDKTSTVNLYVSGDDQNANMTSREVDRDSHFNYVKVFGYGDGVNQLESHAFHTTSVRSYLTAELSSTETSSMTLNDASDFPSSGSVWVGCEKISYSSKSGNQLQTLTRGVAFLGSVSEAYTHKVNSPVCDAQYSTSSPQLDGEGSSIGSNGVIERSYTDRTIIDQSALDILAEKVLLDHIGVKQ